MHDDGEWWLVSPRGLRTSSTTSRCAVLLCSGVGYDLLHGEVDKCWCSGHDNRHIVSVNAEVNMGSDSWRDGVFVHKKGQSWKICRFPDYARFVLPLAARWRESQRRSLLNTNKTLSAYLRLPHQFPQSPGVQQARQNGQSSSHRNVASLVRKRGFVGGNEHRPLHRL